MDAEDFSPIQVTAKGGVRHPTPTVLPE